MARMNKHPQKDLFCFALRILPQIRSAFILQQRKISLEISTSKTFPKNIFPKTFSTISHDYFSDQKKGCSVSPDNLSIQIERQSILHDHFSDQKNSRSIFHDQKLILGIDLFVRQGRGVLNTPHMYPDF